MCRIIVRDFFLKFCMPGPLFSVLGLAGFVPPCTLCFLLLLNRKIPV
jgi:hypothetical protein